MNQNDVIDVTGTPVEELTTLPARVVELQVEIKALHRQYRELTVSYAVEIGRRLTEAKGLLPHGAWGAWLRENVSFSQRTAGDLMRMFTEYGADQQGLLGAEAKSQAIANLSVTQAVRLLALPEEEREEMAETATAQGMSTRELEDAIRERDEARRKAREAVEDAKEAAAQRTEARKEQAEAQKEKDAAERRLKEAGQQRDALKQSYEAALRRTAELEKQLKAEESREPEVKVIEDEETKKALAAAQAEAERLRRELRASDADVAEFRVYFEGLQLQAGKIAELLGRMEREKADKLRGAVRALLDKLGASLGDVEGTV